MRAPGPTIVCLSAISNSRNPNASSLYLASSAPRLGPETCTRISIAGVIVSLHLGEGTSDSERAGFVYICLDPVLFRSSPRSTNDSYFSLRGFADAGISCHSPLVSTRGGDTYPYVHYIISYTFTHLSKQNFVKACDDDISKSATYMYVSYFVLQEAWFGHDFKQAELSRYAPSINQSSNHSVIETVYQSVS